MPCNYDHELALRKNGIKIIAGIDEVGRGPLAGPVVAAAVILPNGFHHDSLTDSKKLTHKQREVIYEELLASPKILWAVAIVESDEVDRLNIATIDGRVLRSEDGRAVSTAFLFAHLVPADQRSIGFTGRWVYPLDRNAGDGDAVEAGALRWPGGTRQQLDHGALALGGDLV